MVEGGIPTTSAAAVIYADPPWQWQKSQFVNRGSARTVEKEYATMTPEEIADLPVGAWAADNAVLFLWTTGPKLPIGIDILRAWGFTYKTVGFTWAKENRKSGGWFLGMGFYTRANAEFCLLGTKGKGLKRKDAGVPQLIVAPVAEHSRKPAETRKRIERLYDGPYLELFARERAEGWQVWGNQTNLFEESRDESISEGNAREGVLALGFSRDA